MIKLLTNNYDSVKQSSQQTIKELDEDFDKIVYMINRRRQLLKNQLMSQYEDKLSKYM